MYTYIGQVESVDPGNRTLRIDGPAGIRTVALTDRTRIWLDRSKHGVTSAEGDLTDCRKGRTVEIKYVDAELREVVDWIKVEVPTGLSDP